MGSEGPEQLPQLLTYFSDPAVGRSSQLGFNNERSALREQGARGRGGRPIVDDRRVRVVARHLPRRLRNETVLYPLSRGTTMMGRDLRLGRDQHARPICEHC